MTEYQIKREEGQLRVLQADKASQFICLSTSRHVSDYQFEKWVFGVIYEAQSSTRHSLLQGTAFYESQLSTLSTSLLLYKYDNTQR